MGRTVSQYFNQIEAKNEQRLVEDLIIESIKINGLKVYYIPRTETANYDSILGEDPLNRFEKTFPIEMYFNTPAGWDGSQDHMTPVGLIMSDQTNFICSRRRFNQVLHYDGYGSVPTSNYMERAHFAGAGANINEERPLEGALIYFPVTRDLFEITKVDHESVFHQLGALYVWKIYVTKFAYSHEKIEVGIPEIDRISPLLLNSDNLVNDPIADNTTIRNEATESINFDETNPFGEPDGYQGPTNFQDDVFQDDGGFQ